MKRRLRGRWMWGILGALATAYLVQRSRRDDDAGRRVYTLADDDRYRRAMGSVARVGKAVVDTTMRAVRQRG